MARLLCTETCADGVEFRSKNRPIKKVPPPKTPAKTGGVKANGGTLQKKTKNP